MTAGAACTLARLDDRDRVPYGAEADHWDPEPADQCHGCGVMPGQFHHLNCNVALPGVRRTGARRSLLSAACEGGASTLPRPTAECWFAPHPTAAVVPRSREQPRGSAGMGCRVCAEAWIWPTKRARPDGPSRVLEERAIQAVSRGSSAAVVRGRSPAWSVRGESERRVWRSSDVSRPIRAWHGGGQTGGVVRHQLYGWSDPHFHWRLRRLLISLGDAYGWCSTSALTVWA
jgi:hypothetical protein